MPDCWITPSHFTEESNSSRVSNRSCELASSNSCSNCDDVERSLIGRIFDLDYPYGRKMQLKELVTAIGNIADRSENTADRIAIVAIKRKV